MVFWLPASKFGGLLIVLSRRRAINPAFFNLKKKEMKQKSLSATHCFRGIDERARSETPVALRLRALTVAMCFLAGGTVAPPGLNDPAA